MIDALILNTNKHPNLFYTALKLSYQKNTPAKNYSSITFDLIKKKGIVIIKFYFNSGQKYCIANITIKKPSPYCWTTINTVIPALNYYVFYNKSHIDYRESISFILDLIRNNTGLNIQLEALKIKEIEIFKDLFTRFRFTPYSEILRHTNPRKHTWDYETRSSNTHLALKKKRKDEVLRSGNIYDKSLKIGLREKLNITRGEVRIQRTKYSKKIQDRLQYFRDITNEKLKATYCEYFTKPIFGIYSDIFEEHSSIESFLKQKNINTRILEKKFREDHGNTDWGIVKAIDEFGAKSKYITDQEHFASFLYRLPQKSEVGVDNFSLMKELYQGFHEEPEFTTDSSCPNYYRIYEEQAGLGKWELDLETR